MMGSWGYILLGLVAVYGMLVLGMYLGQRKLLYLPPRDRPETAMARMMDFQEVSIATQDGLSLNAWYRPPAREAAPVLLYLHGNAGHIGHRLGKVVAYHAAGMGVLLLDWRGYGGNPGQPTEQGLYEDGRAALAWLREQPGGAERRVILYGESLGSGVATWLAARHAVAAVVLEAPFTSIGAVAQFHYPYLPARWLTRDRYDSLSRITSLQAPLLILHGEGDQTVPLRFGQKLFEAASDPKHFASFPGAAHNDLYEHGAEKAVLAFLAKSGAL